MQTPDSIFEHSLIPKKCRYLLAIDEVGRGPWAGPLHMAGCLFDLKYFNIATLAMHPIRDSKLLPASQRNKLASGVLKEIPSIIKYKDNNYIDKYGLVSALKTLVEEISNSFPQVDFLLIDGNYHLDNSLPYKSIIKGDRRCFTIASASIIAKVERDRVMVNEAKKYPQYGFNKHKGYGTAQHLVALKKYGPCAIHRQSFKPLQAFLLSPQIHHH